MGRKSERHRNGETEDVIACPTSEHRLHNLRQEKENQPLMGSQGPHAHRGPEDDRARAGVAECSVLRVLAGAHFTSPGKTAPRRRKKWIYQRPQDWGWHLTTLLSPMVVPGCYKM